VCPVEGYYPLYLLQAMILWKIVALDQRCWKIWNQCAPTKLRLRKRI
jgi:hypothetical protein